MKKSKSNKLIYFILCIIVTTLLDLNISNFITSNLQYFNLGNISNYFDITYYENTGAAFSIFQNNVTLLIGIAFAALVSIITILIKYIEKTSLLTCFFFAMLISGIICNTYERLHFGFVRDFFNIKFINFPVFNISDVLINISVLAIMIVVLKYKKKNSQNDKF